MWNNKKIPVATNSETYFWMSSEPTTLRKVALVWLATAFANRVFPVPGGPYRITPCNEIITINILLFLKVRDFRILWGEIS